MCYVDADVHEDIQGLDLRHIHRYQAAVGVMNQQITSKSSSGIVVDAASTVRDIAHDKCFDTVTEAGEDIGYRGGEEQKAFRKLKCYLFGTGSTYSVYGFGYLE